MSELQLRGKTVNEVRPMTRQEMLDEGWEPGGADRRW